jgi:hypothetical protein
MTDIKMSVDDTLELDTTIKKSTDPMNSITVTDGSDYDLSGFQTHTGVFDPQSQGSYTLDINGQQISIEVTSVRNIPDADLTKYSLTDPDNRISVINSQKYEARMPNGTNEVTRLFKNIKLDDYSPIIYAFNFEVLNHNSFAQYQITWSNKKDSTAKTNQKSVGVNIGSRNSQFAFSIIRQNGSTKNRKKLANLTENQNYYVEIKYNLDVYVLTVTLYKNQSQIAQKTETIPNANYNWHYTSQSVNGGFNTEGSIDIDVKNVDFKEV